MITDTAAPDEARVEAIHNAIAGHLDSNCIAKDLTPLVIDADPPTARILALEAKLAALTTVAEDAKAMAKAALQREADLEEQVRVMARDAARYRWLIQNESRLCSDFDEVAGERQQFVIEARFEHPNLDAETVGEFIDRQVQP